MSLSNTVLSSKLVTIFMVAQPQHLSHPYLSVQFFFLRMQLINKSSWLYLSKIPRIPSTFLTCLTIYLSGQGHLHFPPGQLQQPLNGLHAPAFSLKMYAIPAAKVMFSKHSLDHINCFMKPSNDSPPHQSKSHRPDQCC